MKQLHILFNQQLLLRPAFSCYGGIHHIDKLTGQQDYVPPIQIRDTISMSFDLWLKYHASVNDKYVLYPIPYEYEELAY